MLSIVEHPIDVFDTSISTSTESNGAIVPGRSRVDTCDPTLGVLTQEEVYACFGIKNDDTPELKGQIAIARHATGLAIRRPSFSDVRSSGCTL